MQQYDLPIANDVPYGGGNIPTLPPMTPQGYNVVLRLDFESAFIPLMPIGDALIDMYETDEMMWDISH